MKICSDTNITIVIPKKATPREKFAAEELKKYLYEILGCCADISDESFAGDAKIIIGGPERNCAAKAFIGESEFDALVPGPEGIFIKTYGKDTLLIAGSSKNPTECERGTIYAVYEFLERYAGASFAAYTNPQIPGGNKIPQLPELCLCDVGYIKPAADLKYRTVIVQYGDNNCGASREINIPFLDWLVQNRYNRILTWCGVYDEFKENGMEKEAEKRGIRFTVGHHSASKTFLPPHGNKYFPKHYFETNPEYYKLLEDGTRFVPDDWNGQWIFCSRNEELIAEISGNIIKWIEKNSSVDMIAFWPQDGIAEQCTCAECSKYSKVCNYTYFLNAVAKSVSAVYPYIKIDMLAYVDLWTPPEELQLDASLVVDEATWHSTGLRCCGKPDGSGILGTHFEETLLKWHELGAEVVFYDYYMGIFPVRQRYIPMADEIQALCKGYLANGFYGTATQMECYNLWNHIFNFYCFGRTAYDTSLNMNDNLDRFLCIFGNGKEHIREIITEAEKCLDGQVPIVKAGHYLMANVDKEKIYALFEKAFDAAESAYARNNIRMFRMAFRYSDLECAESVLQSDEKYTELREYDDPTGELTFLCRYDSFRHNDPGYAIMIPVVPHKETEFIPDKWYEFEK
ncbi:MAG: DUF4838 domain-containing protein [Oscillospiraceae bacterium]|nr:DUF4838 domain-containing protein [Oscillospiraceae bacterium]